MDFRRSYRGIGWPFQPMTQGVGAMEDPGSCYMHAEVNEGPQVVQRVMDSESQKVRAIAAELGRRDIRHIVLAARGTSDNAAQLARYVFEYINGIPVSLAAPSIYTIYGGDVRLKDALVIGISQSGEGLDVLEVVKRARASGGMTIAITNNSGSALAAEADHVIECRAGVEKSVAATKTYIGQLAGIYLLSLTWAKRGDLLGQMARMPRYLEAALTMEGLIRDIVPRYRYMNECVVAGRGFNYSTALEAALKMKETCYVGSQPYSSADFLHGPIAMIDEGFPVFLIAPPGKTLPGLAELSQKLVDRRAETVVLGSSPEILAAATVALRMPAEMEEVLTPLSYIVPMQLFSCHLALTRGLNPDRPRGLSKVTLTR